MEKILFPPPLISEQCFKDVQVINGSINELILRFKVCYFNEMTSREASNYSFSVIITTEVFQSQTKGTTSFNNSAPPQLFLKKFITINDCFWLHYVADDRITIRLFLSLYV